jgi:hypothetical protein
MGIGKLFALGRFRANGEAENKKWVQASLDLTVD